MKKIFNGEYKCFIRQRKFKYDGKEYTELLFLHHNVPMKVVKELDKLKKLDRDEPEQYIDNIEDRKVWVKILGDWFFARIVRPSGHFFHGQQSYGTEISRLLSEYFGIKIYKKDYHNYDKTKKTIVAFTTYPSNNYVYELDNIKSATQSIDISKNGCPIGLQVYTKPVLVCISCQSCKFATLAKDKKEQKIYNCFCPKLQWPE